MLSTVAVCPGSPLLVPGLETGVSPETPALCDASGTAQRVAEAALRWIAVGVADQAAARTPDPRR